MGDKLIVEGIDFFVSLAENDGDEEDLDFLPQFYSRSSDEKFLEILMISRRENGLDGYHCHLVDARSGSCDRMGYAFTMYNGQVYAFPHGKRRVDLMSMGKSKKEEFAEQVRARLSRFDPSELRLKPDDAFIIP